LSQLGRVSALIGVRRQSVSRTFACSRPAGVRALHATEPDLLERLRATGFLTGRVTHSLLTPEDEPGVPVADPARRVDTRA